MVTPTRAPAASPVLLVLSAVFSAEPHALSVTARVTVQIAVAIRPSLMFSPPGVWRAVPVWAAPGSAPSGRRVGRDARVDVGGPELIGGRPAGAAPDPLGAVAL